MIRSMTAFASRSGSRDDASWQWEMRSVNARGLDLRLRLPDGIDGLEPGLRAALSSRLSRGAVTLALRLTRDDAARGWSIDEPQLDRVLQALDLVQERAMAQGITLAQPTAADVLSSRGVMVQASGAGPDDAGLSLALLDDIGPLIDAFLEMRAEEGAALHRVLLAQIDEMTALLAEAGAAAAQRDADTRAALEGAWQRLLAQMPPIDETRLAQELALLAIRGDVTE